MLKQEQIDAAVKAARAYYASDEIEIDDKPRISEAPEGVWIAAWVFVHNDDMEYILI